MKAEKILKEGGRGETGQKDRTGVSGNLKLREGRVEYGALRAPKRQNHHFCPWREGKNARGKGKGNIWRKSREG